MSISYYSKLSSEILTDLLVVTAKDLLKSLDTNDEAGIKSNKKQLEIIIEVLNEKKQLR